MRGRGCSAAIPRGAPVPLVSWTCRRRANHRRPVCPHGYPPDSPFAVWSYYAMLRGRLLSNSVCVVKCETAGGLGEMSVSEWPRTLIRRWYLTVLGLAVTIGLVAAAAIAVPVSYTAKADVVLIPPANSTSNSDNPLLGLTGLTSAADVLARAMSDPSKVNQAQAAGRNRKVHRRPGSDHGRSVARRDRQPGRLLGRAPRAQADPD